MGLSDSIKLYFHDVGPRFYELSIKSVALHMVTYPAELLGGSLLPWSIWFVSALQPSGARTIARLSAITRSTW